MSGFLIGISGFVLGIVLATAGIFYDQWQFWAVFALSLVQFIVGIREGNTDQ